jgi:hypothetical protein
MSKKTGSAKARNTSARLFAFSKVKADMDAHFMGLAEVF